MSTRRALGLRVAAALLMAASLPSAAAAGCRTRPRIDAPPAVPLAGRHAVFVARDLGTGACHFVDEAGAAQRHSPWSTFKIPNLLIALTSGAAASLDEGFAWDPARRPAAAYWPADWAQSQTLGSAFERSAVWVFQDLALRIGAPRYRDELARLGYGNAAVADGDDAFWLGGSLRISPLEQVAFLSRLLSGEAGIDAAALAALERAGLRGERAGHRLVAKTGSGPLRPGVFDGPFEGWYVGYVRRPDAAPVVFALHAQGPSFRALRHWREERALELLGAIGAWPAAGPGKDAAGP